MSRYKEYVPNERIVDRAVVLWMAMLANPKYDNLGENSPESPDSIFANTMCSMLAGLSAKNNDPDTLTRFGQELRKILLAPLEWESDFGPDKKKYTTLFNSLSVDYHPDIPLRTAADRAGLKMEFPWKTSMYLSENRLSLGYGYGAEYVYHYPMSGGRWLVTTLSGSDIKKVIALVEAGKLTAELTTP